MRIIDKNSDYYDFYQNIYRDETFVFDRRDSYPLSKDEFANSFYDHGYYFAGTAGYKPDNIKYVLLQICNNFWLFELTITKEDNCGKCIDYELMLLNSWTNYNVAPCLINLSAIRFSFLNMRNRDAIIKAAIDRDYRVDKCFNKFEIWQGAQKVEKHIPLLKNIGIPALVPALDIYLALEVYFAKLVTNNERTESIGITNKERIENHGYDYKTSFRGRV